MDLFQALTNPEFGVLTFSLVERLRSLPSDRKSSRSPVQQRRARYGSVDRAILQVLGLATRPLNVVEIHAEIERQLGGALSYASVKASLSRLAKRDPPIVRRESRGIYRLL